MKCLIAFVLMLSLSHAVCSQSNQVTIFCQVNPGGFVDYNDLDRVLPDSIKKVVMIQPQKDQRLRRTEDALLWMSLNGWKVLSAVAASPGFSPGYLLSRDIYLDDAAKAWFIEKLKNVAGKPQKYNLAR